MSKFTEMMDKRGLNHRMGGVGDGWVPLLEEMFDKLAAIGWKGEVRQIKEKFGGCRIYITGNEDAQAISDEYGGKSYHICEYCGNAGELRRDLDWILTLCDEHYKEKQKSILLDEAQLILSVWQEYRFRCSDTPGAVELLDAMLDWCDKSVIELLPQIDSLLGHKTGAQWVIRGLQEEIAKDKKNETT